MKTKIRLGSPLRYFRLRPFSEDTEEARSAERYRRALWTIAANLGSRSAGVVLMLLSVRWAIPYLGPERFGAWMTIASLASVLSVADMGISNALTTRVAEAAATGDRAKLVQTVSGGLGSLAAIAALLLVLLPVTAAVLPWAKILHLHDPANVIEVRQATELFGALFALSIIGSGVARCLNGMQRGFEVHIANAVATSIAIGALALSTSTHAKVPLLLLCTTGVPLAGSLCMLALLWKRGVFVPSHAVAAARLEARPLLRAGGLFLILQISMMVSSGADSVILATARDAVSVSAYSVTLRLAQLVSQPLAIMNAPLWAAYADASACNDKRFIRRTLARSAALTLFGSVCGGAMLLLTGAPLIEHWTKDPSLVHASLLAAFGLWLIVDSLGNVAGVLLNGLGLVQPQVWIALVHIGLALPVKIWAAHAHGAYGLVFAGSLIFALTLGAGYGIAFRRTILERIA